jgi:hypothetical protein
MQGARSARPGGCVRGRRRREPPPRGGVHGLHARHRRLGPAHALTGGYPGLITSPPRTAAMESRSRSPDRPGERSPPHRPRPSPPTGTTQRGDRRLRLRLARQAPRGAIAAWRSTAYITLTERGLHSHRGRPDLPRLGIKRGPGTCPVGRRCLRMRPGGDVRGRRARQPLKHFMGSRVRVIVRTLLTETAGAWASCRRKRGRCDVELPRVGEIAFDVFG